MFKLAILYYLFNFTTAYITKFPDFWYLETFNHDVEGDEEGKHHLQTSHDGEPLWVLDLEINMLDSLKLRRATADEIKEFDTSVGPLIEKSKKTKLPVRPTPAPSNPAHVIQGSRDTNRQAVNEIMTMVNKYILSGLGIDRDSHMPEDTDVFSTPTLALYFKSVYSAVILKYGKTEWRFFFSYPSPLPSWFYEDHSHCAPGDAPVPVPDYVQADFFTTFSQLLRLFFRTEI